MKPIREYFKDPTRLSELSPMLLMVLADVIQWADQKQIPILITDTLSTIKEDIELARVSNTHCTGRAFDVSARGWTKDQLDEAIRIFSFKYNFLAAIGHDGSPRLVYLHDAGTGSHLHFQIHQRYAMKVQ